MRKPLTKSETDDLNSVLERAAQRLERRKALTRMDQAEALKGVLAALRNEPREA